MVRPQATVVVVPRERFSFASASLESIFENTSPPFELVYVDGASPPRLRRYLEAQARQRSFRLIRTEHYLSPNRARNLGVRDVTTQYVVFVDNDVIVSPGWLDALVECAEQTGASVVGPLYYAGRPGSQSIHMAGGIAHIEEKNGKRVLHERHHLAGHVRAAEQLLTRPCELVEFHCVLVRTGVFEQLGPLDENLLSALEHVDLCLAVRERGGSVYFEPKSVITYVPPPPLSLSDYPYFMLRWSDAWNEATVQHFRAKWRLEADDETLERMNEWLRKHRRIYFARAWDALCPVVGWRRANMLERVLNRCMVKLLEARGLGSTQAA